MKLSTVILPSERWHDARRRWRHAEELGFHAAYTYDHLSWRSFRDEPWFSMVPTLAAASLVTSTLRLGPLVTTPNFRHPLLLAKDLIALDDLSEGRLIVGVGAGGRGFDATAMGHDSWGAVERHERFKEFTLTLERLLREPSSSVHGEFYSVSDTRQLPGPVQRPRPPLLVSALGPRSISFAAAHGDGWVSVGAPPPWNGSTEAGVRQQVALLDEALSTRERAVDFDRLLLDLQDDESPLASYESFLDWAGRYGELGFSELVVHYPIKDSVFDYDDDVFERIATEGREAIAGA